MAKDSSFLSWNKDDGFRELQKYKKMISDEFEVSFRCLEDKMVKNQHSEQKGLTLDQKNRHPCQPPMRNTNPMALRPKT